MFVLLAVSATVASAASYSVGTISDISALCSSRNAEVEYLRAFSISSGWLSAPYQVSTHYGSSSVWPGDTFGISMLSPATLALSWGSATPATGKKFDIYAARVSATVP